MGVGVGLAGAAGLGGVRQGARRGTRGLRPCRWRAPSPRASRDACGREAPSGDRGTWQGRVAGVRVRGQRAGEEGAGSLRSF